MEERPVITLTTDFGNADGYVGTIKGVILSINPQAQIIDISHEINSYDIQSAAWILNRSIKYFPRNSIHLAVIDPGVGSARKKILLKGTDHIFIGPDNGLFSPFLKLENLLAYELTSEKYWLDSISQTFQARDIFAPVAAHISLGTNLFDLGKLIDKNQLEKLEFPGPSFKGNAWQGNIVYIDKFGNLVTNISGNEIDESFTCFINNQKIGNISKNYSSVQESELVVLVGSHGFLEIAAFKDSAKAKLRSKIGDIVICKT